MKNSISTAQTEGRLRVEAEFAFGRLNLEYIRDQVTGVVGLALVPASLADHRVRHRDDLSGSLEIDNHPTPSEFPFPWEPEPLIQLKWIDDSYPGNFCNGHTLRGSRSTANLEYLGQQVLESEEGVEIVTVLNAPNRARLKHHVFWPRDASYMELWTVVENTSTRKQTLQMLSSFTLGHISPFHQGDAPERLHLHRFRSQWSAEGRLDSQPIESMALERSWAGYGTSVERFGQVGSMPVRRFFPFVAIEDRPAGTTWAASLGCGNSWQIEVSRRNDALVLSGGLADADFGQWTKTLLPDETFTTPHAVITCVAGDLADACDAILEAEEVGLDNAPESEREGGIVFNEWCQTWGKPTLASVQATIKRLRGTRVKYFVIDAGWFKPKNHTLGGTHGDWLPDTQSFPGGLSHTAQVISRAGMIPGLWFEMETCGERSTIFQRSSLLLHRDGYPLDVGGRRFLDFTNPKTLEYLQQRVLSAAKDAGFGYLKIDYNDTIGVGADGCESPGEKLRIHIDGVQSFFEQLREAGLIVENCSSGGHRIVRDFVVRSDQFSFSDAHETQEIPIIAASLHRLAPPAKSQIWAVLHAHDDLRRTAYSLSATFLGRMCLSGDVTKLSAAAWTLTLEAMEFYEKVWPIIRRGKSRLHGPSQQSWRHPRNWQAVVRNDHTLESCLVVLHTFSGSPAGPIYIPLPKSCRWKLIHRFPQSEEGARVDKGMLIVDALPDFSGVGFALEKI